MRCRFENLSAAYEFVRPSYARTNSYAIRTPLVRQPLVPLRVENNLSIACWSAILEEIDLSIAVWSAILEEKKIPLHTFSRISWVAS